MTQLQAIKVHLSNDENLRMTETLYFLSANAPSSLSNDENLRMTETFIHHLLELLRDLSNDENLRMTETLDSSNQVYFFFYLSNDENLRMTETDNLFPVVRRSANFPMMRIFG